jgi:hypothetical protein
MDGQKLSWGTRRSFDRKKPNTKLTRKHNLAEGSAIRLRAVTGVAKAREERRAVARRDRAIREITKRRATK